MYSFCYFSATRHPSKSHRVKIYPKLFFALFPRYECSSGVGNNINKVGNNVGDVINGNTVGDVIDGNGGFSVRFLWLENNFFSPNVADFISAIFSQLTPFFRQFKRQQLQLSGCAHASLSRDRGYKSHWLLCFFSLTQIFSLNQVPSGDVAILMSSKNECLTVNVWGKPSFFYLLPNSALKSAQRMALLGYFSYHHMPRRKDVTLGIRTHVSK